MIPRRSRQALGGAKRVFTSFKVSRKPAMGRLTIALGFFLAAIGTIAGPGSRVLAQDPHPPEQPLRLADAASPFTPDSAALENRLPPLPKPADGADDPLPGVASLDDVEVSQSTEGETPKDPLKDFARRLADLDKKFKQREDAEKKAAEEKFPNFKMTGFMQVDTAWFSQSPLNRRTVGDAQDGMGFRRARLAADGKVAEFTSYRLDVDFAFAGRPSFFDLYIDQGNIPYLGAVRVGQFPQPFSVESFSGFKNQPFLELSLPFLAFVPFRRVGISGTNATADQMTNWSYSGFRTGGFNNAPLGDDRFGVDIGDIGGYSVSGRVTHLLWYDEPAKDRYLWHIGASYDFSQLGVDNAAGFGGANLGNSRPFYQARVIPEFALGYPEFAQPFGIASNSTPIFADTGRYEASSYNLVGIESVAQWGPWSAQTEFMTTIVNSIVGPIYYRGAYGEIMYRLTGEHRGYDKKTGAFGKVVPYTNFLPEKTKGIEGWGAWEVAARYSYVDLDNPDSLEGHYLAANGTFTGRTDLAKRLGAIGNGQLQDTTLGVTWFMTAFSKIQFNWIHAMLDNKFFGTSHADLFVTRFQVEF